MPQTRKLTSQLSPTAIFWPSVSCSGRIASRLLPTRRAREPRRGVASSFPWLWLPVGPAGTADRRCPETDPISGPVRAATIETDAVKPAAPVVGRLDDQRPRCRSPRSSTRVGTAADDRDARKAMVAIMTHRVVAPLLSDEYVSVDGALVKTWTLMRSFQPKVADASRGRFGQLVQPTAPPKTAQNSFPYEPAPVPRRDRQSRNAAVDLRGGKARDRDACPNHRARRTALQEVAWHGRDAVLHQWRGAEGGPADHSRPRPSWRTEKHNVRH